MLTRRSRPWGGDDDLRVAVPYARPKHCTNDDRYPYLKTAASVAEPPPPPTTLRRTRTTATKTPTDCYNTLNSHRKEKEVVESHCTASYNTVNNKKKKSNWSLSGNQVTASTLHSLILVNLKGRKHKFTSDLS